MVSTVRPKASATPKSPMPTCGKPAAITALPQPPNVSQKVPIASAAYFLPFITCPPEGSAGHAGSSFNLAGETGPRPWMPSFLPSYLELQEILLGSTSANWWGGNSGLGNQNASGGFV